MGGTCSVTSVQDDLPRGAGGSLPRRDVIGNLLDQARAGSTVALGRLMEGCRKYLLLVANEALDSDLRPKGGASDLVQDTFVGAHRDFAEFHGSTEPELLAWLTKILTNRISNNVRHYRYTHKRDVAREVSLEAGFDPQGLAPNQEIGPDQAAIAQDEAGRLKRAIASLPEPLREVLVLRTWERRSFAEVAARLNGTPESVRKLWGRAVRQLQEELDDHP